MPETDVRPAAILKGAAFAERLARICEHPPAPHPWPDLKYRRILLPGIVGGEIQFAQLAFVAHALRIRGAEPTALLCDEFLPACTMKKADHHESACSRWCYRNIGPFIRATGLPHRWYSEFITAEEKHACACTAERLPIEEWQDYEFRGIALGEHVDRSVESYFKVGAFDLEDPAMVAKGREFLAAALCLTLISERALEDLRIEKVFMEDGEKIDWGVLRAVARQRGLPVDVVLGAPRGNSFLIEHDRLPDPSDPYPLWPRWRELPLTAAQNAELGAYFERRAAVPYEDQCWTATARAAGAADVRRRIGLPRHTSGLIFAMFPNVSFDAQVTTRSPTYDTAAEWVAETIRFFERRPEHHLVVKIHPSEKIMGALDPTTDYLAERFDVLPPNVHVVPPETNLMAIDLIRLLDAALVYTSTVGVEAAYFGKPVINAGGGWHAGRGISIDTTTPAQYTDALAGICSSEERPAGWEELGRRYAYAVFFRSVLPIRHFTALYPNVTALHLDSLNDLAPGCDDTIDGVCRGVLYDEPFCRREDVP